MDDLAELMVGLCVRKEGSMVVDISGKNGDGSSANSANDSKVEEEEEARDSLDGPAPKTKTVYFFSPPPVEKVDRNWSNREENLDYRKSVDGPC